MLLQNILLSVLLTSQAHAWANYGNCKCHDSNTGLQNDEATKGACATYADAYGRNFDGSGRVVYSDTPHHQCAPNSYNGMWIDNGKWDTECYKQGEQFYQVCWDKQWT